jgi:hypothetical protein
MAYNTGTVLLNFGPPSGADLTGAVAIDSTVPAVAKMEAYFASGGLDDDIVPGANKTYKDHRYVASICKLTCQRDPIAGSGFVVYGTYFDQLSGAYLINWIWTT